MYDEHRTTAPTTGSFQPAESPSAPCLGCREIKERRYEAVRRGDKTVAAAMADVMGLHLRAVHR
ncbi:hypothetical protein GCM10010507_30820 [Streptomyces cinnamoneus]|uniref:Uncharacterized protein n=1 Tax=Streptomyces cinnamoneus TaxID=53446 RepID=A0A918TKZ4_STRCJ|nr:hypothetical protein GCM10010507_30820 [Streptomyces cinnamoneus]